MYKHHLYSCGGQFNHWLHQPQWNNFLSGQSYVIGCNRFSRRIIYLKCSPNNLAEIVLQLFEDAIEKDHGGGLWPSRIRVDRGVKKVPKLVIKLKMNEFWILLQLACHTKVSRASCQLHVTLQVWLDHCVGYVLCDWLELVALFSFNDTAVETAVFSFNFLVVEGKEQDAYKHCNSLFGKILIILSV